MPTAGFPALPTPASRRPRHRRSAQDYATSAAFLSALSLTLIALLGSVGVLVFIAISGALAVLNWRHNLRAIARLSFLLIFPILAILSTTWSDAPHATMRAGLQLLLTVAAAILIGTNLPARKLIVVLFWAAVALCSSALPNLPYAIQAGVPLTSSILGSKNQLGFAAYLLFATAVGIGFDREQHTALRVMTLLAAPTAIWIAYLSRSGGASVSIALTLLLFPVFALLMLLKPRGRIAFSLVGLIAFASALFFREELLHTISTLRSDVLEKNETLTGRTYLWDVGAKLWQERPMFGHGYGAFWRHGNLEAEALWRWGGIGSRTGFNFHNIFVETKVDLGILGLVVLIMTCGAVVLLSLWRQLRQPSVPNAFMISIVLVLLVRSTIENGLIAQFSGLTLILVAAGVYGLSGKVAPYHRKHLRGALVENPSGRRFTRVPYKA